MEIRAAVGARTSDSETNSEPDERKARDRDAWENSSADDESLMADAQRVPATSVSRTGAEM